MEELLQAIAAHPERFSGDTYLPCGLRAAADAFTELHRERARPVDIEVSDFLAA